MVELLSVEVEETEDVGVGEIEEKVGSLTETVKILAHLSKQKLDELE